MHAHSPLAAPTAVMHWDQVQPSAVAQIVPAPAPKSDCHILSGLFGNLLNIQDHDTCCDDIPANPDLDPNHHAVWCGLPGRVTELDFSMFGTFHSEFELPESIAGLKELRSLVISGNGVKGSVPQGYMNLTHLVNLDLSHNHLTGDIPMPWNLNELNYLNLSMNNFKGRIPDAVLQHKIVSMDVTHNCLDVADLHIPTYTHITALYGEQRSCSAALSVQDESLSAGGQAVFAPAMGVESHDSHASSRKQFSSRYDASTSAARATPPAAGLSLLLLFLSFGIICSSLF
ncbi:hypothetical protein HK101_006803 [Irineochytrium annulatum]|nr:hypothetical protein HK101_006803 [Irineochytrium annulatum]